MPLNLGSLPYDFMLFCGWVAKKVKSMMKK